MDEIGSNSFIEEFVPETMANTTRPPRFEGTLFWSPVESTVSEKEINELESYYGHPLPESHKAFLMHRHFIDLHLGELVDRILQELPRNVT